MIYPCQGKCVWCSTHKKNPVFKRLYEEGIAGVIHRFYADAVRHFRPKVVVLSGGEPLLYPALSAFLKQIAPFVERIDIFTSYQFNPADLERLHPDMLPLDKIVLCHTPIYFEPERWRKLTRGFPFERYIENIKHVVDMPVNKRFKFIMNHTLFREEIRLFRKIIRPDDRCELSLKIINAQGAGLNDPTIRKTGELAADRAFTIFESTRSRQWKSAIKSLLRSQTGGVRPLKEVIGAEGWGGSCRLDTSLAPMMSVLESRDVSICVFRKRSLELRFSLCKADDRKQVLYYRYCPFFPSDFGHKFHIGCDDLQKIPRNYRKGPFREHCVDCRILKYTLDPYRPDRSGLSLYDSKLNAGKADRAAGVIPHPRRRLLLVLTEFPPKIGGMQTHAFHLCKYLSKKGYALKVLTYRSSREEIEDAKRFDRAQDFPISRCLSRLSYWYNMDKISEIARRFHPDLIYASTVFYGFLRDLTGLPVVCRSVGNDILRPWIAYPFRFASRLLAKNRFEDPLYRFFKRFEYPDWIEKIFYDKRHELMRRSARCMDMVLANSKITERLLYEIGLRKEQVRVIVGGSDVKRFSGNGFDRAKSRNRLRRLFKINDDQHLIMTACRMVRKKGIDFLLRSFSDGRKILDDAHLLIVGDGRYGNRYRRMADEMGVSNRVTFTGWVDHMEIQHYYWASDLFVLASREEINSRNGLRDAETMGRVLCEANAAGLPVVASRSGGIPSVITHQLNGLLFEPDDLSSFICQVKRIFTDKILARRLVKSGLEIAQKKFDWPVVLRDQEVSFSAIMERRLLRE